MERRYSMKQKLFVEKEDLTKIETKKQEEEIETKIEAVVHKTLI